MEYAELGRTGVCVSRLGAGCSQVASLSTRHAFAEVRATLRAAFERGVTLFDTADVYGQGDSERLLARLFGGRRDEVCYCTKAGLRVGPYAPAVRLVKPLAQPLLRRLRRARRGVVDARRAVEGRCFEPGRLRRRLEDSLRRLRTDRVDVFLLHGPPPELLGEDGLFETLEAFVREGKARACGVSCGAAADAALCAGRRGVSCVELPAGPHAPGGRRAAAEAGRAGLGVIVREVFAGGAAVAAPADAARLLRSALGAEGVTSVLVGMTCRDHLAENLRAAGAAPAGPGDGEGRRAG